MLIVSLICWMVNPRLYSRFDISMCATIMGTVKRSRMAAWVVKGGKYQVAEHEWLGSLWELKMWVWS